MNAYGSACMQGAGQCIVSSCLLLLARLIPNNIFQNVSICISSMLRGQKRYGMDFCIKASA